MGYWKTTLHFMDVNDFYYLELFVMTLRFMNCLWFQLLIWTIYQYFDIWIYGLFTRTIFTSLLPVKCGISNFLGICISCACTFSKLIYCCEEKLSYFSVFDFISLWKHNSQNNFLQILDQYGRSCFRYQEIDRRFTQ